MGGYIDLLEKASIIFRLPQLRKNQRVQIGRHHKIYFYDLSVRNVLIDNFNPVDIRGDSGALWKNFILVERLKRNQAERRYFRGCYWRSHDKQEVDLIEGSSGLFSAFECKCCKQPKAPRGFISAYPNIAVSGITKDNYWEML